MNNTPPDTNSGQNTKYKKIYVVKSKMELVGPIQIMKLPTLEASHFLGLAMNSSSTLSHGMAVQERS